MIDELRDTKEDLLRDLKISENGEFPHLERLVTGESKFVKDTRINLKNSLQSEFLSGKEAALIALSVAVNENNRALIKAFEAIATENEANDKEIAEVYACTSLLATNNVFYRFRHFTGNEYYQQKPARIKMNIMARPILGKEMFELISLVVSAVNGCESCVKSHEHSLLQLGTKEDRIFDAIRLGAVVTGIGKLIN